MKLFLLELNEFNIDLLQEAAEKLHLKNIRRLLLFHKTKTHTEDLYESDFLEPWVQWVSVHTGIPSKEHGIKHLGDVPDLHTKQIWESLSAQGMTSGIWGAMNASLAGSEKSLFFVPDPWTASEKAFPEELNRLLNPLRLISKNYTNQKTGSILKQLRRLLTLFVTNGLGGVLAKQLPRLLKDAVRFGGKHFVFISTLDTLSTSLFLKYKERYNPDFSILFLNSIAHLQHHHWKESELSDGTPLAYGFRTLNQILGKIFASLQEDELFIVTNALSQKNTHNEKPWVLYRQTDQRNFLRAIGVDDVLVESHMTHDAHLFFPNATLADLAKELLEGAHIEGEKLFCVESYEQEKEKLFYKLIFTDPVGSEATFQVGGKSFRFFDLFKAIVTRTGKHIPEGDLLCNAPLFPEKIENHQIYKEILSFYQTQGAPC